MNETNIDNRLLEYIRKELNDSNVSYANPPQSLASRPVTKVYSFQLKNVPTELSGRLVLRVYPEYSPLNRVRMEGILHNYLVDQGYPAPHIPFIYSDPSILGGTFIVMEFVPGETLATYNKDIPEILAEVTVNLHQIDPEPLRQTPLSVGIEEKLFTGLGEREDYIHSHNLNWLKPALGWIHENRPQPDYAICHGDIHAGNILVKNGKVSGVLDWSEISIDDPCRDVGSTIILYSVMAPCIRPERTREFASRLEDFLNLVMSKRHLDSKKLEYYQAVRCLYPMTARGGRAVHVRSIGILEAAIERFKQITGIKVKPE